MAEEKLLPRDALEKNVPRIVGADEAATQQRPIPPLAGFWFRLGALLLDIFILRAALQLTLPVLRPVYLQLGLASVALELVVIFLYLFLAEGQIGKGKTIGKAILGIRTTDRNGEPIDPRMAAIRAGVLLLVAVRFLPNSFEAEMLIGSNPNGLFVFRAAFRAALTAYIIANVFLTVLDPLKRAVHDRAAGTLVVRESGEHNLGAYLEQVREGGGPLAKRALQVSAVAFLALGALQVWGEYRWIYSDQAEREMRFQREFNEEFGRDPFRVHLYAPGVTMEGLKNMLRETGASPEALTVRTSSLQVAPSEPSTDTLTLIFLYRAYSAVESDDYGTSDAMKSLMSRAVAWSRGRLVNNEFPLERENLVLKTRTADGITTKPAQPRYVTLLFSEQVSLIFLQRAQPRLTRAEVLPLDLPEGFYEEQPKVVGTAPGVAPKTDKASAVVSKDNATSPPTVLPSPGNEKTSPTRTPGG